MNKNIELLETLVNEFDEFGQKYINLIKSVIKDGRLISEKRFSAAKNKTSKENFFKNLGKEYIYCEVHHIIPLCCGGSNEGDNLVYLYCTEEFPEHLLAHEYLWKSNSLFTEHHSQLAGSFFKMTYSRKISSRISIEEAAKLRKEYGDWKSKSMTGRYGMNKRARKIIYNGKEYPSSNSLTQIEIDGKKRDRHTILYWAKIGAHGLKLASGLVFPPKVRKKKEPCGIKIIFNGKVYPSARSLVGIELDNNIILTSHPEVLKAARKQLYGLKLLNDSDLVPKQKAIRKPKEKKISLTKEEQIFRMKKSIPILFNGKVYPSARSLESVIMMDGKCHSKGTILRWARENKNGLKLVKK